MKTPMNKVLPEFLVSTVANGREVLGRRIMSFERGVNIRTLNNKTFWWMAKEVEAMKRNLSICFARFEFLPKTEV